MRACRLSQRQRSGSRGSADDGAIAGALPAGNGTATVSWEAPTTTTTGSALTDLAGYRIYYGISETELSQAVNVARRRPADLRHRQSGRGHLVLHRQGASRRWGWKARSSQIVSKTITLASPPSLRAATTARFKAPARLSAAASRKIRRMGTSGSRRLWLILLLAVLVTLVYLPSAAVLLHQWCDFVNITFTHGWLILAVSVALVLQCAARAGACPRRTAAGCAWRAARGSFAWLVCYRASIQDLHITLFPALFWLAVTAAFGMRVGRLCWLPSGCSFTSPCPRGRSSPIRCST